MPHLVVFTGELETRSGVRSPSEAALSCSTRRHTLAQTARLCLPPEPLRHRLLRRVHAVPHHLVAQVGERPRLPPDHPQQVRPALFLRYPRAPPIDRQGGNPQTGPPPAPPHLYLVHTAQSFPDAASAHPAPGDQLPGPIFMARLPLTMAA